MYNIVWLYGVNGASCRYYQLTIESRPLQISAAALECLRPQIRGLIVNIASLLYSLPKVSKEAMRTILFWPLCDINYVYLRPNTRSTITQSTI